MRIAVTGANGHVGVNLCKALLTLNHEVRALAHHNIQELQGLPLELVNGDVLDYQSLKIFLKDIDVVYHLAARISITGDSEGLVSKTNANGTQNILNAAIECKVKRFIHFSSIHAFRQKPNDSLLDETRPLVDSEGFAYDLSKATGERYVNQAVKNGLDAVILSPTAIFGPMDPQPSLVGSAVLQLYYNKIPALVPGGYNWVDVRDVVSGAISAMQRGRTGEKYLLAGHWHTLKELSALIQEYTGKNTVKTVLPFWVARVGLPFITAYSMLSKSKPLYTSESLTIIGEGNKMISHTKAQNELGFCPRPFAETIRDLLEYFKLNGYIPNAK